MSPLLELLQKIVVAASSLQQWTEWGDFQCIIKSLKLQKTMKIPCGVLIKQQAGSYQVATSSKKHWVAAIILLSVQITKYSELLHCFKVPSKHQHLDFVYIWKKSTCPDRLFDQIWIYLCYCIMVSDEDNLSLSPLGSCLAGCVNYQNNILIPIIERLLNVTKTGNWLRLHT